jgi:hypothetical protein
MKKLSTFLCLSALTALTARADALLFQDSTNYPAYTNGCIEGQGQWYCYSPATPYLDALITNNVLYLSTSNHDSVAAPGTKGGTNGWAIPNQYTYASFTVNVSKLPGSTNGGYFCQLQTTNDSYDVCHVFVDTRETLTPGTYRLGIANYATGFGGAQSAHNFPMDLATNATYTVVILWDNSDDINDPLLGATLWVNPSEQDFQNAANDDWVGSGQGIGYGYAFGTDTSGSTVLPTLQTTQIGFSPYINAGISNVMVGTNFTDVNTTNLPVIGIQPQPSTNYSGNSAGFAVVASGVDLTYQWYANGSALQDDGVNVIGSTSNLLVINNLSGPDSNYYVTVTDAYGNTTNSQTVTETVITTPTPVFFPASAVPAILTNNLFGTVSATNIAMGTGPIQYQWYVALSNSPASFTALPGQTSPVLSLYLADYTYAGASFYVAATSQANGGSTANGPTYTLDELTPLIASMLQLHNYMLAVTNQIAANKTSGFYINNNNLTVGGYVVDYGWTNGSQWIGGYGNAYSGTPYVNFFIEDESGLGVEVYLKTIGNANTSAPPVGAYVTVIGPLEVYDTELEITPANAAAITVSSAPVIPLTAKLFNQAAFNNVITNYLGTNALLYDCGLVTLTNVYFYGSKTGGALGTGGTHSGVGGIFYSNGYTLFYCTIGQYSASNTNIWEVFQPTYNYYGSAGNLVETNPFNLQPIPASCYQLTGIFENYEGTPELVPSRLADYVVNPPSFTTTVTTTNFPSGKKNVPGISLNWTPAAGSTYSVYSAAYLLGPWTQVATSLNYYPANGTFTDTNAGAARFYRVSTP